MSDLPNCQMSTAPRLGNSICPQKGQGDRDRRPFWAGGENEVARRLLETFGRSLLFFSTDLSYA